MRLGKRPAEDGEILRKHIHRAAVDGAPAGDHTIAGRAIILHIKISAAVRFVHVVLFKRTVIEQHVEPLARGELTLRMLLVDTRLATAQSGLSTAFCQFF